MENFSRFERALMKIKYKEKKLPSPVEGMFKLKEKALEVGDIIDLSIMTDQIPPESVRIAAAKQALEGGYIKNSLSLRQKISQYYEKYRGVKFNPENEIFITVGSQLGIDSAFKLLINPGDEIILFEPDYATYEPMINFYGGKVVSVPLTLEDNKWSFNKKKLSKRISKKTKLVVISNPNNPSGYIYRKKDIEDIVELVKKNDCWLISDEIWSLLILNNEIPFTSIATFEAIKDRLITLFSPSKTFGMSGYRTGAILGPQNFINAITQVVRFSVQAAPTIGQIAFEKAMDLEITKNWVNDRVKKIKQRAIFVAQKLKIFKKIECAIPESGVFLFPSIKKYKISSLNFALKLMEEKKVFILPGYFYGSNSDDFVRISLSVPEKDFELGFENFFEFLEKLEKK